MSPFDREPKSGVLKRRTAVHNPDRQDASGGPRLACESEKFDHKNAKTKFLPAVVG